MAKHQTRRPHVDASEMRRRLEVLLRQGTALHEALKVIDRSRSWYEGQRRADREWATLIDQIRAGVASVDRREQDAGEFETFAERFLGIKVWAHQRHMIDLLEGREPEGLHPSMEFVRGSSPLGTRLLVTVPPNHAKSMTISISYATYRLIRDPGISILIVSKTQRLAQQMLYAIKQRLTHPMYADLQLAFAPPDGWRATADSWTASTLYLGGDDRESGEKDPSVAALGMGGQIYGARANLIIVDDAVVLSNAHEHEKQMDWLRQEVATRLGPGGQLLVVGTRVASKDLYSELMNPDNYTDGTVPWTMLRMPAVLEYTEDTSQWVTLWPESETPFVEGDEPLPSGNFARWNGERLARVRNEVGARKWSLVYQNQDVDEEATFDPVAVTGCVNGMRKAGPLNPEVKGHPDRVEGMYRICSMDPAISGNTAAVAYAVDRATGKRYVLDVKVITGPTPAMIKDLIMEMTEMYRPHEWIIEDNAFQGFLVYDEDLNQWLSTRGVPLKPHRTGGNKKDPEFGVASMSTLFGQVKVVQSVKTHAKETALIELPSSQSYGIKMLVDELIQWSPHVKTKQRRQDTVMALWFCETRAREVVNSVSKRNYFGKPSSFASPMAVERRYVVNLDDVAQAQHDMAYG